jgi:hypothetical protein
MPKLKRICIACEEPMKNEDQLCAVCFVENAGTKLLGSSIMSKVQFLITDTVPKDFTLPKLKAVEQFLQTARTSKLLILLRYDSKYLGGIVAFRDQDQAGLYFKYVAAKLPLPLILFVSVLALGAAIKGGEQEVYIPTGLATLFEAFCKQRLSLEMAPKFLSTQQGFKNLILRDLDPMFCETCEEILENDFNEASKGAGFAKFTDEWSSLSYTPRPQ